MNKIIIITVLYWFCSYIICNAAILTMNIKFEQVHRNDLLSINCLGSITINKQIDSLKMYQNSKDSLFINYDNSSFDIAEFNKQLKLYLKYLVQHYPKGITIEKSNEKRIYIERVIINRKDTACEYLKVIHSYGVIDYFKNGKHIIVQDYIKETQPENGETVNIIGSS